MLCILWENYPQKVLLNGKDQGRGIQKCIKVVLPLILYIIIQPFLGQNNMLNLDSDFPKETFTLSLIVVSFVLVFDLFLCCRFKVQFCLKSIMTFIKN